VPPVPAWPRGGRRAGGCPEQGARAQPGVGGAVGARRRRGRRRHGGGRVHGAAGDAVEVPGVDGGDVQGQGRDERRLMEAEAGASVVTDAVGEGREAWRERMAAAGFQEAAFVDEAVESAKSLLRKYDSGWEMAAPAAGAVALRWKGQPVSFCSLWRPV
jgi:hypothetical protein